MAREAFADQNQKHFGIAAIASSLELAVGSPQFRDSVRLAKLLRYLVDEEVAGRGESLNAYSIAFDVHDRNETFDPAIDSIVRVEMRRLRQRLGAWNDDPANTAELRIDVAKRSYRPTFTARTIARSGEAPADGWRQHLVPWWLVVSAAVVAIGAILGYRHDTVAKLCRSARPELALPLTISGVRPEASDAIIVRLKGMMEYYPLVTAGNHDFNQCPGVPKYGLTISKAANGLTVTLTSRDDAKVLQTFDVPFKPGGSSRDQDIVAARIAFRLGHDSGYIVNDAMRRTWAAPETADQFICLMRAHRYYYSNAGPTFYAAVRSCLIKEFRRSSMADVPAMLAAIELEPRQDPNLIKYQTHNYYNEAIAVASRIDRFNAELIVAQLRAMRMDGASKRGDVQIAIQTLDAIYPYEPYIRNQVSITQCKVTQEYTSGYRNIALYKEIAMEDNNLPYAEIYCNLATGNVQKNRQYFSKMLNDASPYIQMINLYEANQLNDPTMKEQALGRLRQLNCTDRTCLLGLIDEVQENPDIYGRLRAFIDCYIPAGSQVIDLDAPTTR